MSLDVHIQLSRDGFDLDAAFVADPGVTVLFGPSGAGKTTILQAVAGLLRPNAGYVQFGPTAWFDRHTWLGPAARRVGYVFQDGRLFPHLSVKANLGFAGRFRAKPSAHLFDKTVQLLGLEAFLDRKPAQLSGGEGQRVALGRALLSDPQVLCMDEPLSALDHSRRQAILPYIERIAQNTDIPILYVTHDVDEMARLATNLVVLDNGQMRAAGPLELVLSDPDVIPSLGVRAAGTVLQAVVEKPQSDDGLMQVSFPGGTLSLPQLDRMPGQKLRLRVPATDIILATKKPSQISALNVLKGQIKDIHPGKGPGVIVRFQVGPTLFLARVTKASANRLGLEPGKTIYAILKATAFDPASVGT